MDNELKYSFLVSVYYKENPDYFRLSLDSMIGQTLPPDEIVLVEDGKLTSELDELIEEYCRSYAGLFNIVKLKENKGLGLALNEGLNCCKNELVARMDTDDICVKDRCEAQINEFKKNPNLDIVGSHTDEFVDNPRNVVSSRVVPLTQDEIIKFSKRRSPFNHPTVMFKKSSVLKVGGYGDYRRAQDYDLFIRMLNEGKCQAKNIDRALILFRADENNIVRRKKFKTISNYIKMVKRFYKKGYVGLNDYLFVCCSQIFIFIIPKGFARIISERILRKKK